MIEEEVYVVKNRKRAIRRHHNERLKKKTKRMFKDIWREKDMCTDETVGRWHNNIKKCSCGSCGNQRHNGVKTLQERKALLSEADYRQDDTDWDDYLCDDIEYDFSSWCLLCDKEFIGECPSCGHRPEYWWD